MYDTNHEGVSAKDIVEVTLRWETQAFAKLMEGFKIEDYKHDPWNPKSRANGRLWQSLRKDHVKNMIKFWNTRSQQHQDEHFAYVLNFGENEKNHRSDLYNWAKYVWETVGDFENADES